MNSLVVFTVCFPNRKNAAGLKQEKYDFKWLEFGHLYGKHIYAINVQMPINVSFGKKYTSFNAYLIVTNERFVV